ncbi:MAG: NAD-dependent epimerase/dehydratase family protein, partial [Propionibacteriales bacterium]|nr:NAD-dependent epimerase/dehydratase family protein [Propionibacteriales bacterium]
MKVVVTGASGFLGQALVPALRADGHEVVRLVRREPAAPDERPWKPGGWVDPAHLADADAVLNLAGPGMGDRPWTPAYRRAVCEARVSATRTLAAGMAAADPGPRALLSMSGVGFYGNPGEREIDESAPRGDSYIAEVADAWEAATAAADDAGI